MYEDLTYERILKRMLSKVATENPNLDTREGSLIFNALAPAAVELQNMYIELDTMLRETFADTASRPYLILRAADRRITPEEATKAIRQGEFNIDIPIGSRYSLNQLNYIALERVSAGIFKMECETAGAVGNYDSGTLIPIEYIDGLTYARLTDILIPGEDEEDTERLRQRYIQSFRNMPFAGNISDYKMKVRALDGVGGVKVYGAFSGGYEPADLIPPDNFAAWLNTGDIPADIKSWLEKIDDMIMEKVITIGAGTVRLVIVDSSYSNPSQALIDYVQQEIDPPDQPGEGLGVAPINHMVKVVGIEDTTVDITFDIAFQSGYSWETIEESIKEVIDKYFKELAEDWENKNTLVVRISQIETRILDLAGVIDIENTTLNGATQNLALGSNNIPIRGAVVPNG